MRRVRLVTGLLLPVLGAKARGGHAVRTCPQRRAEVAEGHFRGGPAPLLSPWSGWCSGRRQSGLFPQGAAGPRKQQRWLGRDPPPAFVQPWWSNALLSSYHSCLRLESFPPTPPPPPQAGGSEMHLSTLEFRSAFRMGLSVPLGDWSLCSQKGFFLRLGCINHLVLLQQMAPAVPASPSVSVLMQRGSGGGQPAAEEALSATGCLTVPGSDVPERLFSQAVSCCSSPLKGFFSSQF